jgi:hypothetical protein
MIVKVDSQMINAMNLCPERYNLEMIQHWRPVAKAEALERGSIIHHMVQKYREAKMEGRLEREHAQVVNECVLLARLESAATTHIKSDEIDAIIKVFHDYVLRWQHDGWEILAVEQPFAKIIFESPELQVIYEGIIDALVIDPKIGKAVVDTKSEGRKSYPYALSNQFQGYEWAFGVPVIIDKVGLQTSLPMNERMRRQVHESGAFAVEEWRQDVLAQVVTAIGWHQTLADGGRVMKNRTSCDKYSGCIFQKVCAVPAEVREFKLQAHFYKDKKWDPFTRDAEVDEAESA